MTESITNEMQQIKMMISQTFAKRESLKNEMERWYEENPGKRYKNIKELIIVDSKLSELDSHYKRLWDFHNAKSI